MLIEAARACDPGYPGHAGVGRAMLGAVEFTYRRGDTRPPRPCEGCGVLVRKRRRPDRPYLCIECAAESLEAWQRMVHARAQEHRVARIRRRHELRRPLRAA